MATQSGYGSVTTKQLTREHFNIQQLSQRLQAEADVNADIPKEEEPSTSAESTVGQTVATPSAAKGLSSSSSSERHSRVFGQKNQRETRRETRRSTGNGSLISNGSAIGGTGASNGGGLLAPSSPRRIPGRSPGRSPVRVDSPASISSLESGSSVTSSELSSLACPICNESMVTLLQLNRHIDDVHGDVEKGDNEQIKSWFKKKVVRAKQLQTVTSVFNSRFGKLDLFETDEQPDPSGEEVKKPAKPAIADDNVTRAHWQRPTGKDKCSDLLCDKVLNARNGSINCRKCGKLFCNAHTMYQMKLAVDASRDPDHGSWCRVCETCFKSQQGYNDHSGKVQDLTGRFKRVRQRGVDEKELEVNKLEKRLVKLLQSFSSEEFQDETTLFSYTKAQRRREIEREITQWEADKSVTQCPLCQNQFGYSLRKHHCRLCGRVVCANHSTDCSRDVELLILAEKLGSSLHPQPSLSIRICRDCKDTVFSKRNFERDLKSSRSSIVKQYESMARIRNSLQTLEPRFQAMLTNINDPDNAPSHEVIQEATKVRKKMLDAFLQYDSLSRKLLTLQVNGPTEKRLQKQIYGVASQYLQDHMLPLKALPKLLKHSNGLHARTPSQLSEVETINSDQGVVPGDSSSTPTGSLTPAPAQSEVKQLQEQLIVMMEQKFLVSSMVDEANGRRKFDEVAPLQQSLDDLEAEIQAIEKKLGKDSIIE